LRDDLKRGGDAALGEQIFDIAQAERESIIEPDRMGDDLSVRMMASEVGVRDQVDLHRTVKATVPMGGIAFKATATGTEFSARLIEVARPMTVSRSALQTADVHPVARSMKRVPILSFPMPAFALRRSGVAHAASPHAL
jgi:hypothetical protein